LAVAQSAIRSTINTDRSQFPSEFNLSFGGFENAPHIAARLLGGSRETNWTSQASAVFKISFPPTCGQIARQKNSKFFFHYSVLPITSARVREAEKQK
jgi:hypothetical protein